MNVPAWAFSNLCIGRTYDANNNTAGVDIFPPDIPTRTENVNTFSFRYNIVKSNEDVRDLLNISGDLSLKIKANIFRVEGAGKYINNNRKDEGTTEVLAVMKCTTVSCDLRTQEVTNGFRCFIYLTLAVQSTISLILRTDLHTSVNSASADISMKRSVKYTLSVSFEPPQRKSTWDCLWPVLVSVYKLF